MFSVIYFKYIIPFIIPVIWILIFRSYDIPWSTFLFCPPVMYFIYKLLDFSSEKEFKEEDDMNSIGEEDENKAGRCKDSSKKRDDSNDLDKDKENIHRLYSLGSYIHELIPHLKDLFRVLFYPNEVSKEEAKSEQKGSEKEETNLEKEQKNEPLSEEDGACGKTKFKKTEKAMNLFKRIYIVFTQGKELRPMDSPFRRLCWAIFSSKDEFISFVEVFSEPDDDGEETGDETGKADDEKKKVNGEIGKAGNDEGKEAGDETGKTDDEKEKVDGEIGRASNEDEKAYDRDKKVEAEPAEKVEEKVDSVAQSKAKETVSVQDNGIQEQEALCVDKSSGATVEGQDWLTVEFNKQAYFLWGFVQAEYMDYDLSLTVDYPYIRIFFAKQLLVEINQLFFSEQIIYKLKIYQAPSQCISIEIEDMRKVRLYNSVIKFVLDHNLSNVEKKVSE